MATIAASVRKTGRVVIADYDWNYCGLTAEIAAQVTEYCFGSLKAPPVRIGLAPVPCPTTRPLENLFYPSAKHIVRAVENLLELPEIDLSREVFNAYEQRFKGPF
jgi:pyruvate dehydrogenase E1 component beta subunit